MEELPGPFDKGTNLLCEGSILLPYSPPGAPAPNNTTLGLGLQHTEWEVGEGERHSVYGKNFNLESDNQLYVSEKSLLLCCGKDTNRGVSSEVGKHAS